MPGQVFYYSSRRVILKNADGVVFVADSQNDRMEANQESLDDLRDNLQVQALDIETIPLVFQWNKRDLPNAATPDELSRVLNKWGRPEFEAVATTGQGVFETLKEIAKGVIRSLSV